MALRSFFHSGVSRTFKQKVWKEEYVIPLGYLMTRAVSFFTEREIERTTKKGVWEKFSGVEGVG